MRYLMLSILLSPAIAAAEPRLELGLASGEHAFSKTDELGVTDQANEPGPENAAMVGLRAAIGFTPRWALEGEAMYIPTKDDVLHDSVTVFGLRAHVRFDILTGKFKPFLVAGMGMHVLRSNSPQMDNDVDESFHWGGGIRYAFTDNFEARLDARDLIVPDRTMNGATNELEVTGGVTWRFGGKKALVVPPMPPAEEPPPAPEPAPVIGDRDGDGFLDNVDKCPDEPETRNGFQDDDGCPDEIIKDLTGIQFDLDSAVIAVTSTDLLEKAFDLLKTHPDLLVEIAGHTSSEGGDDHNLALSLHRAEAVKDYLVRRGISAGRILTVGHGSEVPVGDNRSDDGRRKNRRIEFRVLTAADLK